MKLETENMQKETAMKPCFPGVFLIKLGMILGVMAGCTSSKVASYDYQKGSDFKQYRDCRMEPKAASGVTGLVESRIEALLPEILASRGLPMKADSKLVCRVRLRDVQRLASSPSMHHWGHHWPHHYDCDVYSYQATEMLLQLVDVDTREVVWQAHVASLGKAAKDEAKLRELLAEILAEYPPKGEAAGSPKGQKEQPKGEAAGTTNGHE
ncbi:MAG: hypothetical protein RL095_3638 [Verrucomicrobiota bacterium]|jgi:hypothetical protein